MRSLSEFLLKRKQKSVQRKVKAFNLKAAQSAFLLYNATDVNQEKVVRNFARFLKEEGIKVTSVGFYNKKGKEAQKPNDELSYFYLDSKDLNWLKQIKVSKINDLVKAPFDLLIDLNVNDFMCLQILSTLSLAHFKVGPSGSYRDEVCDMTIKMDQGDVSVLIEELKKYLAIINKN